MKISFTKMHGLGNDFIFLEKDYSLDTEQIAFLCDRHRGVGADGLIVVSKRDNQIVMDYWNADGSVAEMCGNGLRCAVRYALENGLQQPGEFVIKTGAGLLKVSWDGVDENAIEVQVGKVEPEDNPVKICGLNFHKASVGNPHAITFVKDVSTAPVKDKGPQVETDSKFPNKTNVEFAQVVSEKEIDLRIWERGVGETLACGTGMVATSIVASKLGKVNLPLKINVPGGSATISIDDEGYARMKGPAKAVFQGEVEF